MRIYAYLRASTNEQDASRAESLLRDFVQKQEKTISAWFIENESGATLKRPELFRLLDIAEQHDILLVEQIDRISRLNLEDWEALKTTITHKGIRIVALDLPTSYQCMNDNEDEFTHRMLSAINAMMMDMLAAVSRKDYEDRRRRQAQGIQKAKSDNKYRGRPINQQLHANIAALLESGKTYTEIENMLRCSRATIAMVKRLSQNGNYSNKIVELPAG